MGRNTHTWIMKAVPWAAVVVLGIFSIGQLASRSGSPAPQVPAPDGAPAQEGAAGTPGASAPEAAADTTERDESAVLPVRQAESRATLESQELLALREQRKTLKAEIVTLHRALARERARGEHDASRVAALAAAGTASARQLTEAQARITELIEQRDAPEPEPEPEPEAPEVPEAEPTLAELLEAFDNAEGNAGGEPAWIAAATDLLGHEEAAARVRTDEKLRDRLCLMVKALDAGSDRNDLAGTLLWMDFEPVANALGSEVVLTPHVVLGLLHGEAPQRAAMSTYLATHAATLEAEARADIADAVALIVKRADKHAPAMLADAARVLGLLRPATLPVNALTALLTNTLGDARTAAAYALARASGPLDPVPLRGPCLKLLASADPAERLAATMLGERIFADFDFDPHAAPDQRAKVLDRLEAQTGS